MGLFRRNRNTNKPIISQILDLVPKWIFDSCANTFQTDKGCSKYKTYDQFVALTYGQLYKCHTLSDISTGIGVSETFISNLGLKQSPARSTMSDGNKKRDWPIFESLYFKLLSHYKSVLKKHHKSYIVEEIKGKNVKLIDSTTIPLCLSMFDWAKFRTAKGGAKIHTCLDVDLMLPDVINISEAKLHDRYGLEQSVCTKNTIIVEDSAYFDFLLMLNRIAADNILLPALNPIQYMKPSKNLICPMGRTSILLRTRLSG